MSHLKRILKNSLRRKLLSFSPRKDDIFLVSYPKSGNSWLRFMIGSYLSNSSLDFSSVQKIIPDMHLNGDQINQLNNPSPRFIKSHEYYNKSYNNVIYLLRDGRDVAVSYYFNYLKFGDDRNLKFEDFLDKFNSGEVWWNSWSKHVKSWLDNDVKKFHLTRYEDLKANPVGELIKILIFARIPIDYERVVKAVTFSDFENMAKIEEKDEQSMSILKNSNLDFKFVREGKIGVYPNYFNEELLNTFYRNHGEVIKSVGYHI